MNKFKFTIKNSLLYYKFWKEYKANSIDFPDILSQLEKKYGSPLLVDRFQNLDNWNITDRNEWGSARPGNLCTFVKENVSIKNNKDGNSLVISTTPEKATGKDWNGKPVDRPFSSGLITSKFLVTPGQVVSATVNTSDSYAGSWFSFWLYKKDVPGDNNYREIDIFEKFMEREAQKKYSVSVHGGTKTRRELLVFHYPLFFVNEEKLTFTCELNTTGVNVYINGIHVCQADEPDFSGHYHVLFNDGPSTHKGKVKEADIAKSLPRVMEVIDFRIYNL